MSPPHLQSLRNSRSLRSEKLTNANVDLCQADVLVQRAMPSGETPRAAPLRRGEHQRAAFAPWGQRCGPRLPSTGTTLPTGSDQVRWETLPLPPVNGKAQFNHPRRTHYGSIKSVLSTIPRRYNPAKPTRVRYCVDPYGRTFRSGELAITRFPIKSYSDRNGPNERFRGALICRENLRPKYVATISRAPFNNKTPTQEGFSVITPGISSRDTSPPNSTAPTIVAKMAAPKTLQRAGPRSTLRAFREPGTMADQGGRQDGPRWGRPAEYWLPLTRTLSQWEAGLNRTR